jgi:O-antigen/teichoic acid export membrane protein
MSLLRQYGSRIGRDTMIYGTGNTVLTVVSVVTLSVFTHYMRPALYGTLSILFFFAGALTIILNLVPLAGILRWVWVAGEADTGDVDDPSRQAPGGTKRRALGTGCWMSLAFTAVGCVPCVVLATPIAKLLLGTGSARGLVLLAVASGAAGSVFRLTTDVVRMERRPVAFALLLALRPAVALAVAVPLVVSGDGVQGALIGTIVGSCVPAAAAWFTARRVYSAQFSWTDVRGILDLGSKYTFVISGLWVVHNGDAFVLSRFTSHSAVGVYRVASRIGAVLSYLVASFLQAWSPLERGALLQTTYEVHGLQRVHTKMITYFVLCALTLTLALALSGSLVVELAPHSYHGAAGLVPFTAFFFVIYGVFVLIARTTHHVHRDFVHQFAAATAAVVYIGMAVLLCPRWGGYGLAVGASIAMAVGCVCFRLLVPTASHYAILDWPRLLGGAGIAIACIFLGLSPPVGHGVARVLLGLVDFFAIYPAALVLSRVVPAPDIRILREMAIGTLAEYFAPLRRRTRGADAALTLSALDPAEVAILRGLIPERAHPIELAARRHVPRSALEARAARALRTIAHVDAPQRDDAAIAYWLFETGSSAERDVIMYNLIEHGVAVSTLQAVEAQVQTLRRIPADMWPGAGIAEQESAEAFALSFGQSVEVG